LFDTEFDEELILQKERSGGSQVELLSVNDSAKTSSSIHLLIYHQKHQRLQARENQFASHMRSLKSQHQKENVLLLEMEE
jgi:hypothetical protein